MVRTRRPRTRLLDATSLAFYECQIDRMPPFVAVSHVWSEELFAKASSNLTSMRNCIGFKMLRTAWEQTPKLSHVHHFWIDTWCIDQDDPEDKAHQIPAMREIYKQAQMVVVTLKHSFSFSQADWDSVVLDLQDAFRYVRGSFITRTPDAFACYNSTTITNPLQRGLDMVGELATNRWCERVWTAQEYLLARDVLWIGLDLRSLHTAFEDLNSVVDVSYGKKATVLGVRELPTDPWSTSIANLVNLNRIRSGIDHASSAMDLAYNRDCYLPEDQVYGLMGASGVIITDSPPKADLEELWRIWWEKAVGSGLIMWAMMRSPRMDLPAEFRNSANCIMPHVASRFDSFSGCGVNTGVRPYAPFKLHDGALSVAGRVAGVCKIDRYLGEIGHKGSMVQDVMSRVSWNVDIATRFCVAITSGYYGSAELRAYTKWHCDHRDIHLREAQHGTAEQHPSQRTEEEPESLKVNKDLPRYGGVYLAKLQNSICDTSILVNADEIPEGKLLALDVGTKLEKVLTTSGETELTERQIFMVVHVPEGIDRLRCTLHKVGMTSPVFVPRFDEMNRAKTLCGYVLEDSIERYSIGGSSCSYCHVLRTKGESRESTNENRTGSRKRKRALLE